MTTIKGSSNSQIKGDDKIALQREKEEERESKVELRRDEGGEER
jgi:hypothetical protein